MSICRNEKDRHLQKSISFLLFFGIAPAVLAQQNLFNVPNGDITKGGKLFFQEQVNASASTAQSNTTLDYGLGHEWEVGLNLFFLNFATTFPVRTQTNSQNETLTAAPLALLNTQKAFTIVDWLRFSAGAQGGPNLGDPYNIKFAYLTYGTATVLSHSTGIRLHAGLYHGNIAYNGAGNGFLMGGIEFPIVRHKLHFVGDVIQGSHANAVFVPGLLLHVTENFNLSVGWQKPYPDSSTEQGIVFELTFL